MNSNKCVNQSEHKGIQYEIFEYPRCGYYCVISLYQIDETLSEKYNLQKLRSCYIKEFDTCDCRYSPPDIELIMTKIIDDIAQQYQDGSKFIQAEEEFRSIQDQFLV